MASDDMRVARRPSNSGWSSKKRSPQLSHRSRRHLRTSVVRRPDTSESWIMRRRMPFARGLF